MVSISVANGTHSITAAVLDNTEVTTVRTESFTVSNGTATCYAPQVSTSSNRSATLPVAGAVLRGGVYVSVPSVVGITKVSLSLYAMGPGPCIAHPLRVTDSALPCCGGRRRSFLQR